MDLNPSEEQQQLIDAFLAFYAKECPIRRVRAAEPSGHDADLWARPAGTWGRLDMAVDEASGGWGASLLDLALVAEQHGRHLGPAPLIEGQVAARLLARAGSHVATGALGRALTDGRLTTIALHPPKNGALALVPAGAVADEVVFLDHGDRLMCMEIADRANPVVEHRIDAACRHPGRLLGRRVAVRGAGRAAVRVGTRRVVGTHGQRPGRHRGPLDRDRGGVRQGATGLWSPDRIVPGRRPRTGRRGDGDGREHAHRQGSGVGCR